MRARLHSLPSAIQRVLLRGLQALDYTMLIGCNPLERLLSAADSVRVRRRHATLSV